MTADVEIPDEVLHAHEQGNLVFFVGAGASVDDPSNLPSFRKLAEMLAHQAGVQFPDESAEKGGLQLDHFIGQLEARPQRFDAHEQTYKLLTRADSRPNSLHSDIVRLAGKSGAFRVVTTNYDNHLATAALELDVKIPDRWDAPALPMGDDFEGLVHLHGSVLQPPHHMILTDRDFGRAYLTDSWATRFLLRMFERFTVVFIGYSHDDTIMKYLASGLPSGTSARRYAFTDQDSDEKWGYLGITPIHYPVVDTEDGRDYSALPLALKEWVRRMDMGRTDHRARVADIVGGGRQLAPEDNDYLRARVLTEEGFRDFSEFTAELSVDSKLGWLQWMQGIPEFEGSFDPENASLESSRLGSWFAMNFVASPGLNDAALGVVQRYGQSMSRNLYRDACDASSRLGSEDAEAGRRWQTILATSINGRSMMSGIGDLAMYQSRGGACPLPVLRRMVRPHIELSASWPGLDGSSLATRPRGTISLAVNEYLATQQVASNVSDAVPDDLSLLTVFEDALLEAYDLLDGYMGPINFDPLAFNRSAIEPHGQDDIREPIDAILDGLRDCGQKAMQVRPGLPERWWGLGRPLFRRLALHLIAQDQNRGSDEKLRWVLDHGGLYAMALQHETFRVLKIAIPGASPATKRQVLGIAIAGPASTGDDGEHDQSRAYETYNLLGWLTDCDPGWTQALDAFYEQQEAHLNFRRREHPDFSHWMESGIVGSHPPMSVEDFIEMLEKGATEALAALVDREYSELSSTEPRWTDALDLVRSASEARPDLALELWDASLDRNDTGTKGEHLLNAIADGWGQAELGVNGLPVMNRLSSLLDDAGSANHLGYFLLQQMRVHVESLESEMLAAMRKLANDLWKAQGDAFAYAPEIEPLSSAPLWMNSWPGYLAQYWTIEIDRRWRQAGDDWTGLDDEEKHALHDLLSGNDAALDATQPALTGQLYFYFAADEEFASEYLLPLFDDEKRHSFAWEPFLLHARYSDRLLEAGLFDDSITEFGRLKDISDGRLREAFYRFVISVLTYSDTTDARREQLLNAAVLSDDGAYAASFAQAAVWVLRNRGIDGELIWSSWLRRYVQRRLDGVPGTPSSEEVSNLADLIPYLGKYVPEAVDAFRGHDAPLTRSVIHDVPDNVLESHPSEVVDYLAERIRKTPLSDPLVIHGIKRLIKQISDKIGPGEAQPLTHAATEIGLSDYEL
ncbi:SIR2 family protein [Neoactinobaculum massilliense]|uniref:SIR2 family protein n=1 Tax=Neoactinobaculum massilliense TaxID=2364794 RepID=UPI0013DD8C6D|nr:SIR2 family protein [Neoactinobaculum massilliense]